MVSVAVLVVAITLSQNACKCTAIYCIALCSTIAKSSRALPTFGGKPILFLKSVLKYHLLMVNQAFNHPWRPKAALIIRKLLTVCVGFAAAIYNVLLEIFASTEDPDDAERRLHDSDLSGELNHLTGRLDAGTDPFGWYDD